MAPRALVSVLFAFGAALSFAVLLNIERRKALYAALGGALSWFVYEAGLHTLDNVSVALFLGSMAMGLYSEILARKMKSPATIFYIPGFVPLVPGSDAYYAVLAAVRNELTESTTQLFNTLIYSAAIALGLIFASALVAIYINARKITLKKLFKEIK
ncbi:threonine/serine exporter family protein [Clostridiaceae bacterium HFYG-1003]|nr:threonine/serine exporter family protein [Clostridiaceae bacterium HFYG-1003]